MKKILSLLVMCFMIFSFTSCKEQTKIEDETDVQVEADNNKNDFDVDYGNSSIYTNEDIDIAIKLITEQFYEMEGCELHSLSYTSDECNSNDNIYWMNDLGSRNNKKYVNCMEIASSFRSPKEGGGAWEADSEYNWSWWLAREDGGEWELLTWGY